MAGILVQFQKLVRVSTRSAMCCYANSLISIINTYNYYSSVFKLDTLDIFTPALGQKSTFGKNQII